VISGNPGTTGAPADGRRHRVRRGRAGRGHDGPQRRRVDAEVRSSPSAVRRSHRDWRPAVGVGREYRIEAAADRPLARCQRRRTGRYRRRCPGGAGDAPPSSASSPSGTPPTRARRRFSLADAIDRTRDFGRGADARRGGHGDRFGDQRRRQGGPGPPDRRRRPARAIGRGGSPRLGTALRSGETVSYEYAVEARRGEHPFEPVHVVTRNLAGTAERERTVSSTGPAAIRCVPALERVETAVPVRTQQTRLTGRVSTDVGGEGTEFYATRTYRPGDPLRRIDWNRRARTGDLATLEFREERAVTVVLVVDASSGAAVGPDPRGDDVVDRSVDGRDGCSLPCSTTGIGSASRRWPPGTAGSRRAPARSIGPVPGAVRHRSRVFVRGSARLSAVLHLVHATAEQTPRRRAGRPVLAALFGPRGPGGDATRRLRLPGDGPESGPDHPANGSEPFRPPSSADSGSPTCGPAAFT